MKNAFENKKVAIVGGGPGGLLLAKLLQDISVDVTVYERDENKFARQQGATLDLHAETGLLAIAEAGLMEAFEQNYRPGAELFRITDNQLNVMLDERDQLKVYDLSHQEARPEIDRGPLRELMVDALKPEIIRWNSKFIGLQPSGNGWQLDFDGFAAYADIVIGADGANSRIRKYLSDIQPIYSNITIVEGNLYNAERNAPTLWKLVEGGKVFALWEGKTIILSSKGDGSLSFYSGTRETEDWISTSGIDFSDKNAVKSWFKSTFSDWSDTWLELFDSDESYFIPRPQYHFPTDQKWETQSNITMLGDAAHRMPPYAGEGVNQALKDALDLFHAIIQFSDSTKEAFAHFEQIMLERTAVITTETLQNTEMMHGPTNLQDLTEFFRDPTGGQLDFFTPEQ